MLHYAYDRLARFWNSLINSDLKDNERPRFDGSLCESFVTGTESAKTDISKRKIVTTWSTFYIVIYMRVSQNVSRMIFYLISLFWLCCVEGMRKLLPCWTKCVENDCAINVATVQPQYCVVKRYWRDTFLAVLC
jgi:hypothetical protein